METEYDPTADLESRIVYIRQVDFEDLPEDMQEEVGSTDSFYALHSEDGERIALVKDRTMAFILARQNDLAPVAVH